MGWIHVENKKYRNIWQDCEWNSHTQEKKRKINNNIRSLLQDIEKIGKRRIEIKTFTANRMIWQIIMEVL